jgi:hypothetical protein
MKINIHIYIIGKLSANDRKNILNKIPSRATYFRRWQMPRRILETQNQTKQQPPKQSSTGQSLLCPSTDFSLALSES